MISKATLSAAVILGLSSVDAFRHDIICRGAIHAPNTLLKNAGTTAVGAGGGAYAGVLAGAAAGAAIGGPALPITGTIGAVVGGAAGLLTGGNIGNKLIRFRGSAYQCAQFGGSCCTGNWRGTQDIITGDDMTLDVPCRHCWSIIRPRRLHDWFKN